VYIYLSNEETTPVDVFFDDLKVTQVKTPIVQVEDSMPDQYQYNGKELQDELSLGWLDYGARMYMPELGRWGVVDPLAEKYMPTSLFAYVLNSPLLLIDPDGKRVSTNDEESRNILISALNQVLGEKHGFSFTKNGDLKYSAKADKNLAKGGRGYNEGQQAIISGLREISENKDLTIDFKSQSGSDEKVTGEFREVEPEKDESGAFVMKNGRPVLKENGHKLLVDFSGPEGHTGGGTTMVNAGFLNANVFVFPDIASRRQFRGSNGQLTNEVQVPL